MPYMWLEGMKCWSMSLWLMLDDPQAKRMHVSMCVNFVYDRRAFTEGENFLALLDKLMSICTASPPVVKAICQALPGRSLGQIFPTSVFVCRWLCKQLHATLPACQTAGIDHLAHLEVISLTFTAKYASTATLSNMLLKKCAAG